MTERLNSREQAAKAYAEATKYYVPFHAGLESDSANEIRAGVDAAVRKALDISVQDGEFTDLIMAVAYSSDPLKKAMAVIGAMAGIIEMKKGRLATGQVLSKIASIYQP